MGKMKHKVIGRRIFAGLMAIVVVIGTSGCTKSNESTLAVKAEQPASSSNSVAVPVIFKNVAGAEWVICMKMKTDESYTTSDYQLDYNSFVVKSSGERSDDARIFNETSNYIGEFKKVSENSFTGIIYLAAGEVASYDVGGSSSVTMEQALTITAEYGAPITIQWDAEKFSQVK